MRWYRPGLIMLVAGLAVWGVAAAVVAMTKDPIVVPVVIVSGSFVGPVAFVVLAFHRRNAQVRKPLPAIVLLGAFLAGGTFSLLLAAVLETYLLTAQTGRYLGVSLIEETCKGMVIVLVARRLASRAPLDGMVLGATVGAGFAAFENAGYAFNSYITHQSADPYFHLLHSQVNRVLSEPFGHIFWSSILAGALFAAAAGGARLRVSLGVCGAFASVVALHALWDQADGWAVMLTAGLTSSRWLGSWPDGAAWVSSPSSHQQQLFTTVYTSLLVGIGFVGSVLFCERWRHYRRVELARTPTRRLPILRVVRLPDDIRFDGDAHEQRGAGPETARQL